MTDNDIPGLSGKRSAVSVVALILAIIALVISLLGRSSSSGDSNADPIRDLGSYIQDGVLHVGYGGFPPYTILDPANPEKPSGFSVDLVEEFASRHSPPLVVQWHLFSFETLLADLQSGAFDFIADPLYLTIPRAVEFEFSQPYTFIGIAAAVVSSNEQRFKDFDDLDRSDITIAVAEGWTSTEYAVARLNEPNFKPISVTGDAVTQLDEVRFGRADVALNDVPTVAQYVAHHTDVKALWLDNPPSRVAGAFAVRRGELELVQFLNEGLVILIADGTLIELDRRWSTFGELPTEVTVLGAGIQSAVSGQ